jgi:hypothetical protein
MTNPSSSISRSEAGLTLIEILIAIVLLSFIMLGVLAIIDNSQNTKDRTVQLDRDNLQLETALARIEWDVQQIWSPLYFSQRFTGNLDPQVNPGVEEVAYLYENHPRFRMPSKEGLPIPKFVLREKNDVIFLTTANRRKLENQKQSHFMWVRYFVSDQIIKGEGAGEERQVKSLMRQVFPDDPWSKEEFDIENVRSAILLENVEEVEFMVWNRQTRKWETNLNTIIDGESLWRGLQLSLKWKDSKDNERKAIRWIRPLWPAITVQDPAAGQTSSAQGGAQGGNQGTAQGGTDQDGDGVPDDQEGGP